MDEEDGAAGSRGDGNGGADLAVVWARAARTTLGCGECSHTLKRLP